MQKEQTSGTDDDFETNELDMTSFSNSTETNSTQVSCPSIRKKKLNWMINMIVETIEEHVECEPVTIKLKKPKVSRHRSRLSLIFSQNEPCQ